MNTMFDSAPLMRQHLDCITPQFPVIAWWSGGITSAVTCKLCIDWFGAECVKIVFIDTGNEAQDTHDFLLQCGKFYQKDIEIIRNHRYNNIEQIWRKYLILNTATGAKCSQELKQEVREDYQRMHRFSFQAFGFDISETDRALAMKLNYPDSRPIFPLVYNLLSKKDCVKYFQKQRIQLPEMYNLGFLNNNCFNTGCIQGGIGYWQKIQREFPDKFARMAAIEHELTDKKGEPVTMLRDQGKNGGLVFLKPHPQYPKIKDISMMKGREPSPLFECNGFCGTNDLVKPSKTKDEINFQSP